jgi:hypothetical protein
MDLEKLEKLAQPILAELDNIIYSGYGSYTIYAYPATETKIRNLLMVASKTLPEHAEFLTVAYDKTRYGLSVFPAKMLVEHLIELIQLEKASETKIKEMKIFESAEDKLKEAGVCFRKDDYPSTFHSLNTSLELVLKDKIGIPTTITSINTSTIIDILVKEKIEPYLYLVEAKKHVLTIDNKIKHQGYSPSKTECINGMKAMEELISRLRNTEIELSEEVRKKIYEGL